MAGRRADEGIERVAIGTRGICVVDLVRRQIQRLERGMAEELGAEISKRSVKIDTTA